MWVGDAISWVAFGRSFAPICAASGGCVCVGFRTRAWLVQFPAWDGGSASPTASEELRNTNVGPERWISSVFSMP